MFGSRFLYLKPLPPEPWHKAFQAKGTSEHPKLNQRGVSLELATQAWRVLSGIHPLQVLSVVSLKAHCQGSHPLKRLITLYRIWYGWP